MSSPVAIKGERGRFMHPSIGLGRRRRRAGLCRSAISAGPSVAAGRDTKLDRWRSFLELSGREMRLGSPDPRATGPKWTHLLAWSSAAG